MSRSSGLVLIALCTLLAAAGEARAIGWGPTDFLIGGGPNFSNKIGVFDSNLNFKGLLESDYLGTAGMDFDSTGRLVVASWALSAVRVYENSGALVGGFTRPDGALAGSGDVRVAIGGDYIIGQGASGAQGARRFTPQGDFLKQYGDSEMARIAIVPGNHLWSGRIGSSQIRVFDLGTGVEENAITISGLNGVSAMFFSAATNTVFLGNPLTSSIMEVDLNGAQVRVFHAPSTSSFHDVTMGPNGDVFATTSRQEILRWHSDGVFVNGTSTSSTIFNCSAIAWAGNVPETSGLALIIASLPAFGRTISRRRSLSP
jgi:hypothetical protein